MRADAKSIDGDDSETEINVVGKEETKVTIHDNHIVLSPDKEKERIAATVGNSMAKDITSLDLTLEILMNVDLKNHDQLDYVIGQMKQHRKKKKPY